MNKDYTNEIKELIIKASALTGKPISEDSFYIEHQPINHSPKALPDGKMAVYTFVSNDEFLKIGKADKKSKARYQSHHYYIKSGSSTLARSLVKDSNESTINESNVRGWIISNCERFDIIIDSSLGSMTLDFIEGVLHYKYNPRYEGKNDRGIC